MKTVSLDPVKIFIYVSFVFLIWALYSGGYAQIPTIRRPDYLVYSLIILVLAFLTEAIPWKFLASSNSHRISLRDSFISIGVSIFGKYIPGKLWSIIGRASFLARHYSIPLSEINARSLKGQLIVLWSGLLVGEIGIILTRTYSEWTTMIAAVGVGIGILLCCNIINDTWRHLGRVMGKEFPPLPSFSFTQLIHVLPFYVFQWFLWCLGFYLFTVALLETTVPVISGFSFALAAVIGILSFLTPGGIGVREGVLAVSLIEFGIDTPDATTVSIASRLWFLSGECLIFVAALILSHSGAHKS